ncbi:MAG: hypothetical protein QOI76_590 [Frankiales bacterium]|jgi:hypothetical protein|nr:hypothetical protein [Frankiales bacterium]
MTENDKVRALLGLAFDAELPRGVAISAEVVRARHRRRRAVTSSVAAAGAVAIAVSALLVPGILAGGSHKAGSSSAAAPSAFAVVTTAPLADKVIIDGDVVQASGRVVKVPGKPARFCAPVPQAAIGYVPGHEPPPAWCDLGVDLVGVDLTRLSQLRTKAGATEGQAFLRGTFHANVLHVSVQSEPRWLADDGYVDVNPTQCPMPAAGWQVVPSGSNPSDAIIRTMEAFRSAHPGQIVSDAVARPNAHALYMVVAVVDLAVARAALHEVPGQLCLLQSRYTPAQIAAARSPIEAGMWKGNGDLGEGVFGVGQGTGVDGQSRLQVDAMMVTAKISGWKASAPAGLVDVRAWLLPTLADAPLPPLPSPRAGVTQPPTASAKPRQSPGAE